MRTFIYVRIGFCQLLLVLRPRATWSEHEVRLTANCLFLCEKPLVAQTHPQVGRRRRHPGNRCPCRVHVAFVICLHDCCGFSCVALSTFSPFAAVLLVLHSCFHAPCAGPPRSSTVSTKQGNVQGNVKRGHIRSIASGMRGAIRSRPRRRWFAASLNSGCDQRVRARLVEALGLPASLLLTPSAPRSFACPRVRV